MLAVFYFVGSISLSHIVNRKHCVRITLERNTEALLEQESGTQECYMRYDHGVKMVVRVCAIETTPEKIYPCSPEEVAIVLTQRYCY